MSAPDELLAQQFKKLVFISDKDGKEYSCYEKDVKDYDPSKGLTDLQKSKCLDMSLVVGDIW